MTENLATEDDPRVKDFVKENMLKLRAKFEHNEAIDLHDVLRFEPIDSGLTAVVYDFGKDFNGHLGYSRGIADKANKNTYVWEKIVYL
jgi:hypothetical protein